MSRVRHLFMIVLPSMIAGGLIFGPALGQAHDGRDSMVAYADDGGTTTSDAPRRAERPRTAQGPTPPPPPPAPRPPVRPAPAPPAPRPPVRPAPAPGINVTVNGNRIDISGIEGMVRGQLDGVRDMIRNNPNIPPPLRAKILARLDKVRGTVDKRLAKLKGKNLEQMGEELEQMGEEIEQAMEGLEEELEQLGDQLGKDVGRNIEKNLKNKNFKFKFDDHEDDEDVADAVPMAPDLDDVDDGDMREALDDIKSMAIKPQQKEQIARIRAEADKTVSAARVRLDELSKKLEVALADPRTNTGEIERYVDQISAQEAAIRKARIVSWVKARAVLDAGQRKKIEAAASKRHP